MKCKSMITRFFVAVILLFGLSCFLSLNPLSLQSQQAQTLTQPVEIVLWDIRTAFDWYVPQGYAGNWPDVPPRSTVDFTAPNDCGPASAAMLIRWATQSASMPRPQEVRAKDPLISGKRENAFSSNLKTMLQAYNLTVNEVFPSQFTDAQLDEKIVSHIQAGQPVLIPFMAGRISIGPSLQRLPLTNWRNAVANPCPPGKTCINRDGMLTVYDSASGAGYNVGRYYSFDQGHWIVVKGIGQINGERYAIVYDPFTWVQNGIYYYDGSYGEDLHNIKGFDRWYKLNELINGWKDNGASGLFLPLVEPGPVVIAQSNAINAQVAQANLAVTGVQDPGAIQQIYDLTIPLGSIVISNTITVKTWSVRNVGSTWIDREYFLVQKSGIAIQTLGRVEFPTLDRSNQRTVSMAFTSPTQPGTYTSTWQVVDGNGDSINGELTLSFQILDNIPNPTPIPPPTSVPPPSGTAIDLISTSSHTVQPGQRFNPSVTIRLNSGQLLPSRGDHLHAVPEDASNTLSAWPVQAVKRIVNPGEIYTFDTTNDPAFQMTAPSTPGIYRSRWQMRVGGNYVGPIAEIVVNVQNAPPLPPPPQGWRADYFSNISLAGSTCNAEYVNTTYIFKRWDDGGQIGCPTDNFSVQFVRTFYFPGGRYRFHCHKDDACRFFVDGRLEGDWWWDSSFAGSDRELDIPSGTHEIKVHYYDKSSTARIEFWWTGSGFLNPWETCNPNQWCGEYYGSYDVTPGDAPVIRQNEGSGMLERDFGMGGLGYDIPNDKFSARWTRTVTFKAAQYRFHLTHDDGARLYLDDVLVFNAWGSCCREDTFDLWLTTGNPTRIRLEWYDNGGAANVRFWWETIVPCYALNLSVIPSNAGLVSANPAPNCGDPNGTYRAGTIVTLQASPYAGYTFQGWGADTTGTALNTTITMDWDKTITVNYYQAATPTPSPTLIPTDAVILAAKPLLPYCVVRSGELYERLLELTGNGFEKPGILQFMNTNTGETSYHISSEVNWEDTTSATVDMARIKHLLWPSNPIIGLRVRMTQFSPERNFYPISDWSPQFILAEDSTTCGLTLPLPSTPTPTPTATSTCQSYPWPGVLCGAPTETSAVTPTETLAVTPTETSAVTPTETSAVTPTEASTVTPIEASTETPVAALYTNKTFLPMLRR